MQRRQFLEGVGGAGLALLLGNACVDSSDATAGDAGGSGGGNANGSAGTGAAGNANSDTVGGGDADTSSDANGGANAGTSNGGASGSSNTPDAGGLPEGGMKTDAGPTMAACAAAIAAQITCRHDHKLEIPTADLAAGLPKKYDIRGTNATHGHDVTVTAAHFTALKRGETVKIFVESNYQAHNVYLSCATDWKPAARDDEECN